MKVLFCWECGSLFSLTIRKEKTCDCGKVKGMYVNNRQAITNGKGLALGMGTGSIQTAIMQIACADKDMDRRYYLDNFKVITWARPHTGPGNPNTEVVKDEQIEIESGQY